MIVSLFEELQQIDYERFRIDDWERWHFVVDSDEDASDFEFVPKIRIEILYYGLIEEKKKLMKDIIESRTQKIS